MLLRLVCKNFRSHGSCYNSEVITCLKISSMMLMEEALQPHLISVGAKGVIFFTAIIAIFWDGRLNPNSKSKKVVGLKFRLPMVLQGVLRLCLGFGDDEISITTFRKI